MHPDEQKVARSSGDAVLNSIAPGFFRKTPVLLPCSPALCGYHLILLESRHSCRRYSVARTISYKSLSLVLDGLRYAISAEDFVTVDVYRPSTGAVAVEYVRTVVIPDGSREVTADKEGNLYASAFSPERIIKYTSMEMLIKSLTLPQDGSSGPIGSMALREDGKIVLGGSFGYGVLLTDTTLETTKRFAYGGIDTFSVYVAFTTIQK